VTLIASCVTTSKFKRKPAPLKLPAPARPDPRATLALEKGDTMFILGPSPSFFFCQAATLIKIKAANKFFAIVILLVLN